MVWLVVAVLVAFVVYLWANGTIPNKLRAIQLNAERERIAAEIEHAALKEVLRAASSKNAEPGPAIEPPKPEPQPEPGGRDFHFFAKAGGRGQRITVGAMAEDLAWPRARRLAAEVLRCDEKDVELRLRRIE